MAVLVIAEHDNAKLKPATLNAVTAGTKLGGDVALLVAGQGCGAVADEAAKIAGVAKVLVADAAEYAHPLAENLTPLIVALAPGYGHIVATATTFGKNLLPRVAALLDVQQISEVMAIDAPDTFVRPIYAGNALATVKSSDKIKVMTVRGTAFDPAPTGSGNAARETVAATGESGLSRFVGQALSKMERAELTAARVIGSGGPATQNSDNF